MSDSRRLVFAGLLLLSCALVSAAAAPSPTPTPAPTPPPPTIVLTDQNGRSAPFTAAQIEQSIRDANQRIADLTNERNALAGQVIDLTNQVQKMQSPVQSK